MMPATLVFGTCPYAGKAGVGTCPYAGKAGVGTCPYAGKASVGTCPYAGKASVGNGALVPTPRYWCRDPALVPYT